MQLVAAEPEYLPAGHLVWPAAPTAATKLPASASLHAESPEPEYRPASHSAQADWADPEYLPASHGSSAVAPLDAT